MPDVRQLNGEGTLSSAASVDDTITITGTGVTDIKAVMVFITSGLTSNNSVTGAATSIGYYDGTTQYSSGWNLLSGTTRSVFKSESDANVIYVCNDAGDGVKCAMLATAFTTNGVTLQYKTVPDANYVVEVVFYCGDGITNAEVVNTDCGSSGAKTVSLGYQPDVIVSYNSFVNTTLPTVGLHGYPCLGFAMRGTTPPQQVCAHVRYRNSDNPVNLASFVSTDLIGMRFNSTTTTTPTEVRIQTITGTGFTFEMIVGTPASQKASFLVFEFASGVEYDIGNTIISTSSPYTESGLSFEPEAALLGIVQCSTGYDTADSVDVGPFAVHAFNDTDVMTHGFMSQDNAATALTRSVSSSTTIRGYRYDNVTDYVSTVTAFTSTGWTWTLSTVPAASPRGVYFALASGTSAAKEVTLTLSSATGSNVGPLTGLSWAWFDQITPDLFAAPTDKGTGESTDANGELVVAIPNSTKSSGQTGFLIVSDTDGDAATSHKAFAGPREVD